MGSGIVKDRQWISVLIMAAAFIANYVYNVNVVLIILFVRRHRCGADPLCRA